MNHKSVLLALSFYVMLIVSAVGKDADEIQRLKRLVDAAEEQARLKGHDVMEYYHMLHHESEFRILQDALAMSWRIALSNLDAIAENDVAQTIVMGSSWVFPEDEYLAFLNASADLVEAGRLNQRSFLLWGMAPAQGPLYAIFSRKYDRPDVRAVILRVRELFKDDMRFVATCDARLSGEALARLKRMVGEHPEATGFLNRETAETALRRDQEERDLRERAQGERRIGSIGGERAADGKLSNARTPPQSIADGQEDPKQNSPFKWALFGIAGIVAALSCAALWLRKRRL